MQSALTNLFNLGLRPEFMEHARNLQGIREKWVLWQAEFQKPWTGVLVQEEGFEERALAKNLSMSARWRG